MQITRFTGSGLEKLDPDDPLDYLKTTSEVVWIDIADPAHPMLDRLAQHYNFHPLALEDTRNEQQRPKVEEYADHLFIIVNVLKHDGAALEFDELDIFLGRNYIVTVHNDCADIVQEARDRIQRTRIFRHHSSEYLLYVLVDVVVDRFFPITNWIDSEIERLNEEMLFDPTQERLQYVFKLRQMINELWHIVGQQLDMFNVLTRREEDLLTNHDVLHYYLRDVHDHLIRLHNMTSTFRDHLSGVVDLYISANSNRLNVVVNRLAIITIVIGILTVVSGFYGMNFTEMWPPLSKDWGMFYALGLMVVLSVGTLIILRRLRWF